MEKIIGELEIENNECSQRIVRNKELGNKLIIILLDIFGG